MHSRFESMRRFQVRVKTGTAASPETFLASYQTIRRHMEYGNRNIYRCEDPSPNLFAALFTATSSLLVISVYCILLFVVCRPCVIG
jgi:hypothetical protein